MGGKMGAEYWRAYRRANAARLAAQQSARRKAERLSRPPRPPRIVYAPLPNNPIPRLFTGDAVLEHAATLAGIHPFWVNEDAEDAAGDAVLAILEGRDPREAVRATRAAQRAWQARRRPLPEG